MSTMIAAIKITQKQAGIFTESHKLNVLDVSNQRTDSCAQLTLKEQQELLARYKKLAPLGGSTFQLPPQLKMIYSLWSQLHKAGAVNVDSKQACDTFCEKHLHGKTLIQSQSQWTSIIEVLKKWLARVNKEKCDAA